MANDGGRTELFPQESPLGGLWSRAAQLMGIVLGWKQWTQELAAFRVLHICHLCSVCPTELGAGKGCPNSSCKYLSKERVMVRSFGFSWRSSKWMESHRIMHACIKKQNYFLKHERKVCFLKVCWPINCSICTACWCSLKFQWDEVTSKIRID